MDRKEIDELSHELNGITETLTVVINNMLNTIETIGPIKERGEGAWKKVDNMIEASTGAIALMRDLIGDKSYRLFEILKENNNPNTEPLLPSE